MMINALQSRQAKHKRYTNMPSTIREKSHPGVVRQFAVSLFLFRPPMRPFAQYAVPQTIRLIIKQFSLIQINVADLIDRQ